MAQAKPVLLLVSVGKFLFADFIYFKSVSRCVLYSKVIFDLVALFLFG
jgi:hypothetical protein